MVQPSIDFYIKNDHHYTALGNTTQYTSFEDCSKKDKIKLIQNVITMDSSTISIKHPYENAIRFSSQMPRCNLRIIWDVRILDGCGDVRKLDKNFEKNYELLFNYLKKPWKRNLKNAIGNCIKIMNKNSNYIFKTYTTTIQSNLKLLNEIYQLK